MEGINSNLFLNKGEEIQLKTLSYRITICLVVLSLLAGPTVPVFAQEGTPVTPIPPTVPPTETTTPEPTQTPMVEATAEPAVVETAVPVEIPLPEYVLTLSTDTSMRVENDAVTLLWKIEGELSEKEQFVLQITLPVEYAPDVTQKNVAFDAKDRMLSIPVTENSGSVTLQGTDVKDAVTFSAILQKGEEAVAKAEYYLPVKEEFKVSDSGDMITALDGKLTVTIPADTFGEDVTLAIGAPGSESMPAYSLSGKPFEITAVGEAKDDDTGNISRESFHEFESEKQVEFEIQYEDFLDVPAGRERDLAIWWYNPEFKEWEGIASTIDTKTKTIRASTDHFSLFDVGLNTWNASRMPSTDAFQVSEFTGAGSYSFPIEVPTGPGGFQPSLSLNYNSQIIDQSTSETQASWVGMGWSLDTGSIDRDSQDQAINDSAILSVGGVSSRLIRGNNTTEWHFADENGWVVQGFDFDTWTIKDDKGNTYEFNYAATTPSCPNDTNPYRWMLTKQINSVGQEIVYEYTSETKDFGACPSGGRVTGTLATYPTTITYPGSGYRIRFELEGGRQDRLQTWTSGGVFNLYQTLKLKTIYVEQLDGSSWKRVRSYTLNYAASTSANQIWPGYTYTSGGKVLTLESITETGSDGTTNLKTDTFSYSDSMHLDKANNGFGGIVGFTYSSPWAGPNPREDESNTAVLGVTLASGALSTATSCKALRPGSIYRVSASTKSSSSIQSRVGIRFNGSSYTYDFGSFINGTGQFQTISYITQPISADSLDASVVVSAQNGNVIVAGVQCELLPTFYRVSTKKINAVNDPALPSGTSYTTSYTYLNPTMNGAATYESDASSEFRGHGTVTTVNPDGTKTVTTYHQDDVLKGRPIQTLSYDASGIKLISKSESTYSITALTVYSTMTVPPIHNWVYTSGQTQTIYNLNGTAVGSTTTEYFYNSYYQLSQQKEYENGNLYRVTNYDYSINASENITGLPRVQWVTDAGGTILAKTLYFYDGSNTNALMPSDGLLTTVRTLVSGSQYAQTSYGYDGWGNQTTVTTYTGLGSDTVAPTTGAATTTTAYDPTYHTYPVTITNALSQATTITYDYTKGVPLTATDPNYATVTADYDTFGRIIGIHRPAPDTGTAESTASLIMEYSTSYPFTTKIKQANPNDLGDGYYVISKEYDGMGRITQVNAEGIITETKYDSPTVTRQSMPYQSGETVYYTTTTVNPSTRTTTTVAPDGTSTVSSTNGLTSTVTDALGHSTVSTNDLWGRTRSVTPPTGPDLSYEYDPLGNLLQVTRGGGTYSPSSPGSTNLFAWWSMDETSGTRNDSSANAQYLTDNNTVVSQSGMRGNAADLEKDNSEYFSRASSTALQMGTSDIYVGVWMKAESTMSGYPVLVSKRETSSTNSEYQLRVNASTNTVDFIVWGTTGATTIASSAATITPGQWYYVEGWTDKANRTVYVNVDNGTPNSATWTVSENRNGSGTAALLIGARNNSGIAEYWDGLIDEVALYKRKLSAAERAWLFNAGAGHTYSDAVASPSSSQTVTSMTYNNAGQKLTMSDPDMGSWSYTYDALGNLKTQTDARNCVLTMGYDSLNRLTGKSSAGSGCSTQVNTSYTYDDPLLPNSIGHRTSMDDASGETEWLYDKRGRVTKETKTILGTDYETEWGYNNADMITSMIYPDGETVYSTYNSRMQVDNVASLSGTYASSILYDSAGRMTHLIRGNNLLDTAYTYNPWNTQGGRLQSLVTTKVSNQTNLQNFAYAYDSVGNINTILDSLSTPQTQTFGYDTLDRLISASVTGGTNGLYNETYGYNTASGNLETKGISTLTYADSSHKHAVTSAGGNNYTYDANGNMITRDINSGSLIGDYLLAYDAENRLTEVKKDNAVIAIFVYDGDGKRVKSVLGSETTIFAGSHYEVKNSVVTKYYFSGASRIAVKIGTTLNYLLSDHLGSASITTDANGISVSDLKYKAWGEIRDTTGKILTDYTYTGQYSNADDFGLMYYGARWYDSSIGRFNQPDMMIPASQGAQAWDRYAYTNNNPMKYTDPTGHWIETAFDIAMVGVDIVDIASNGLTWGNGAALAVDIASVIIPGIPAIGGVLLKAAKAANAVDNVVDTVNVIDTVTDASKAADEVASSLYAIGNTSGPRVPRIQDYNLKPGQLPDIITDVDGLVVPHNGGASTYETIEQLSDQGLNGHVWELPGGSSLSGFDDIADGIPFGTQPSGHHSLVPNVASLPEVVIESFKQLPWKQVFGPDGKALKISTPY